MDSICQCWLVEVWRTGSDGCLRNSTGKQDCADRWWSCWCWWLCWWWGDPDIVMKIIMIWWLVFQTSNPSRFLKSVAKFDYVAKSHHCSVLGRPSKNCFTFLLWKKNNLHLGCRHSWRSWRSSKMLQSLFLIRISPTPAYQYWTPIQVSGIIERGVRVFNFNGRPTGPMLPVRW